MGKSRGHEIKEMQSMEMLTILIVILSHAFLYCNSLFTSNYYFFPDIPYLRVLLVDVNARIYRVKTMLFY